MFIFQVSLIPLLCPLLIQLHINLLILQSHENIDVLYGLIPVFKNMQYHIILPIHIKEDVHEKRPLHCPYIFRPKNQGKDLRHCRRE